VGIYEADTSGLALRLANGKYALGLALTGTGRTASAQEALTEAMSIFRDSRQQLWHGMTLFRLAELHLAIRQPAHAASHAEQALAILRGIGGEWRRANVLTTLGRGLAGVGQTDRAQVCWEEALSIFDELGSPEAASVRELLVPAPVARAS
jgi:tetratricopeptide (TPR) repeat protein